MIIKRFLVLIFLVLGVSFGGCGEGPLDPDQALRASVASGALRLQNRGSLPVYYVAYDPERLAMFWGPCDRPDQGCSSVPAGGEVRVPFSEIGGYHPDTRQVTIHWWHIVETGGGWKVDELRDLTVRLDR